MFGRSSFGSVASGSRSRSSNSSRSSTLLSAGSATLNTTYGGNSSSISKRLSKLSLGSKRSHRTYRSSYPPDSDDDDKVTSVSSQSLDTGALCCDRCDGKHETLKCPHYKKKRGSHRDEQKGKGRSIGGNAGNFTLKSARVVRQPGDGSCLFHSLAYGYGRGTARSVRKEIAAFIAKNPSLEIADSPLSDWVKWESGSSVRSYASRMSTGGWGGGIEMAAFSRLKSINIHVYESRRFSGGYKRISCFNAGGTGGKTVHVLYGGRVHYDALVPR